MSPLKRLLDAESPEILKKVITEAKAGNMQAAAIILSRTLPKDRLVAIGKMPKVTDAASAMKALGLLFECASSGAITTAEANNLGALARSFVEIDAVAQLKEQVAALEAKVNGQ